MNADDGSVLTSSVLGRNAAQARESAIDSKMEEWITEWLRTNKKPDPKHDPAANLLRFARYVLDDALFDTMGQLEILWKSDHFSDLVSHVSRQASLLPQAHQLITKLESRQLRDSSSVLETIKSQMYRFQQCQDDERRYTLLLLLVLQSSYDDPVRSRRRDQIAPSTNPADDFTATFNGNGLDLLIDHIIAHNRLFPKHPPERVQYKDKSSGSSATVNPSSRQAKRRTFYAKVISILQSSGFGKTKLCVQLGTVKPGMLVCLRTPPPNKDAVEQQSFPEQDKCVYDYFKQVESLLELIPKTDGRTNPRPKESKDHELFNRAHLKVLAWLATYCKTMAHYLDQLKAASGCFQPNPRTAAAHLAHTPTHGDPNACWRTVVFHLANASSFKKGHFFNEPSNLCQHSRLKALFSNDSVYARNPLDFPPAVRDGQDSPPPKLFGLDDLRSDLVDYICKTATKMWQTLKNDPEVKLADPEMLSAVVREHLTPPLKELESIVQAAGPEAFAFVALDECGSVPLTLPIIRRVWFHAVPACTWILLIDTNSDLAPLAGAQATDGSRRLSEIDEYVLAEPFSSLPLDVNLTIEDRQALMSPQSTLSLREVNLKVPKFGRPLWNDTKYQGNGVIKPKAILKKLLWPIEWNWPSRSELSVAVLHEHNQNLLALASRRLHLDLTSKSSSEHWYGFISRQLQHHLRFVGRITSASEAIKSCVQSEPPLEAAAAWFFRSEPHNTARNWVSVVGAIVSAGPPVGINVGASGELGVFLLCSAAADLAVSNRHKESLENYAKQNAATDEERYEAVFGLISVSEWLRELAGFRYDDTNLDDVAPSTSNTGPRQGKRATKIRGGGKGKRAAKLKDAASGSIHVRDDDQDMPDWSEQGPEPQQETLPPRLASWANRAWINFKHPVILPKQVPHDSRIDLDLLAELWCRHATAQGVSNQPGWDLLIPVYVSDTDAPPSDNDLFDISRLSYIAIQVKNRIGSPSAEEKDAPVGPILSFGEQTTKECLEIFFDLNGTRPSKGHVYSQRRHPSEELRDRQRKKRKKADKELTEEDLEARSQMQRKEDDIDRRLLRHHVLISGLHGEFLPILQTLKTAGAKQIKLLFGDIDSLDALEFEQALTDCVRRSKNDERQRTWNEAHARADGQVVLFHESL